MYVRSSWSVKDARPRFLIAMDQGADLLWSTARPAGVISGIWPRHRDRFDRRPVLKPLDGLRWDEPQIADAAVLEVVDRTYQAPDQGTLPIVGAAGGDVLTVRGLAPGTTTLTFRYRQPWEGGAVSEWTYRLQVTVQ